MFYASSLCCGAIREILLPIHFLCKYDSLPRSQFYQNPCMLSKPHHHSCMSMLFFDDVLSVGNSPLNAAADFGDA